MRRYASSKWRIALLAVLLGAVVFVTTSYGQNSGADQAAQTVQSPGNVFTLIMGHLVDPVFWTIFILSVTAVTLIIQGFIQNRASVFLPEASHNQIRELIGQKKFRELIDFTETDPSFVSKALNPALKRAPSFSSMKEAMETAIGEQTAEQFRKIEYLNIIGNLGPLLGLLGTVLGMIEAFEAMHAAGGSAKPSELAHGISTALVHTFLGLALAIPCLAAFGVLRTIVDRLTIRGALIAEEMLLMVKPAEARPVAGPARPASATPQPQVATPAVPRRAPGMPTPMVSG
ncbi:MAG TPA: MotA/TolQ/ExbB proton channel family protein [Tepidisphaeraceae bacterium]|nr:MotA/TolQ/ExbB proton channel family protein [Tepidisphaeraceae bacterium]